MPNHLLLLLFFAVSRRLWLCPDIFTHLLSSLLGVAHWQPSLPWLSALHASPPLVFRRPSPVGSSLVALVVVVTQSSPHSSPSTPSHRRTPPLMPSPPLLPSLVVLLHLPPSLPIPPARPLWRSRDLMAYVVINHNPRVLLFFPSMCGLFCYVMIPAL